MLKLYIEYKMVKRDTVLWKPDCNNTHVNWKTTVGHKSSPGEHHN